MTSKKKGLLDPGFRYTPSHATDIRKTLNRARKEIQDAARSRVVVLPTRAGTKGKE
jgi:hypothetical protein